MSKPKAVVTLDPQVIDVLMPDLVGHDKRPSAYVLYLCLWANTRSVGRKAAFFSYQTLTDRTGLSKTAVQRAAAWLARRHLVRIRRASPTAVPEYTVLTPWIREG